MAYTRTVAIHQPDFFPWLGFFNKYIKSDVFIIADSVQYPKSNGSLTNRVTLIQNKKKEWWTKPINRKYTGLKRVGEIASEYDKEWTRKSLKSIQINYGKAPFFDETYSFLEPLLNYKSELLIDFNMNSINHILDALNISNTKIIYQSELEIDHLWKIDLNDYIIEMVKKTNGNSYLSGDGSSGYQNELRFKEANIGISYTKYTHPVYNQFNTNTFISGLSIIDAFMNLGIVGVKNLLYGE